jgi:hypothetical protein
MRRCGLFEVWQGGAAPITCLVPEGVAAERFNNFSVPKPGPGAAHARRADGARAAVCRAADYDRLLWACDLNFVRGEDSWVRAQWAGKPVCLAYLSAGRKPASQEAARISCSATRRY